MRLLRHRRPEPVVAPDPTVEQAATNLAARLIALAVVPPLERLIARGIGKLGSMVAQRIITTAARRIVHPAIERIVVAQVDRLATRLVAHVRARIEARRH